MEIIKVKKDGTRLVGRNQVLSEGDYVQDGKLYYGAAPRSVLIEGEDQLSTLPTDLYEPGSIAYLAGVAKAWQLDTDRTTWKILIGQSEEA